MSQEVVSFVLRFVREAGRDQGARWRGTVKHVQGSTERQFNQFGEALSFMQSHMNETVEAASKDGAKLAQTNPLFETAKLWGEFVPQYNKLVLDSVSDAVSTMWHLDGSEDAEGRAKARATQDRAKGLEDKLDTVSQQLGQLTQALVVLQNDVAALKEAQAESSAKS